MTLDFTVISGGFRRCLHFIWHRGSSVMVSWSIRS